MTMQCECGNQLPNPNALQCAPCQRIALKKLIKISAAVGAVLGIACSSVPSNYQAACQAVASLLAAC